MSLVHKEWRDVRTLTWTSMALVVALALVVRWILGGAMEEIWKSSLEDARFAPGFIPIVVAIYGAFVASDLIGSEVASRRMDGLALLPVPASRVWLAKVAHLLVAMALFSVWTFVVQAAVVLAIDGADQAGWLLDVTRDGLWIACPVFGAVLCVLFASSLGLRGIAACLVGGMLAGVLVALAVLFPVILNGESEGGFGRPPSFEPGEIALIAALLLALPSLVASWTIVRSGRVHLARWLRPVATGLGVFVATLAVPSVVVAREATVLVPGTGWAHIERLDASPDGRFVAMMVTNRAAFGVVVCDVESGAMRVVAEGMTLDGSPTNWQLDGTLKCSRWAGEAASLEEIRVDPASGRVVGRSSIPAAEWRRELEKPRPQSARVRWTIRSQPVVGEAGARRYRVMMAGPDARYAHVDSFVMGTLTEDGRSLVFCPDADRVVVRSLTDGAERTVFTSKGAFAKPFVEENALLWALHGGRTILVRTSRHQWIVDAATGTRRELPRPGGGLAWEMPTAQGRRRLVFVPSSLQPPGLGAPEGVRDLIDLDTGATLRLGPNDAGFGDASELPDGRLVVQRDDSSVVILGRDLRVERVLVGDREGETR